MKKRNALLWKVSKNNITNGYIFGSMHIPVHVLFNSLEPITSYIDQCELFAAEIPLDEATQMKMAAKLQLPAGLSIEYLWGAKKFNKYSKILQKAFDVDLRVFNHLIPIYLINFISQKIIFGEEMNPSITTLDAALWQYAVENNIQTAGMEDVELHLNVMDSMNYDYQLKALESFCKNVSKTTKNHKKLLSLYKQQDIHALYKYSKKELGKMKQIMLYGRNIEMVQNFVRYTEDQTLFSVVGAGHLSGKKGVLHSLVDEGYSINPIKLSMRLD